MDIQILVQAIIYFCIFIAGFIVSIPIGVNRWNFQGDCILYSDIEYTDSKFVMHASSPANCNFPIYFSVFGMIFYGLGMGIFYAFATFKSIKKPTIGYEMWVMPYILVNGVHAFVTLVVSCMISVGFLQFCNGLEEKKSVTSCGMFANTEWKRAGSDEKFNAGSYMSLLAVAQVASWTCFLLFLMQTALCIFRFIRNRRQRSGSAGTDTKRIAELEPTA